MAGRRRWQPRYVWALEFPESAWKVDMLNNEVGRLRDGVCRWGEPGIYETWDGERVDHVDGEYAAVLDVYGVRSGSHTSDRWSLVLVGDVDDVEAMTDRVWRMRGYATQRLADRERVAWTLYEAVGRSLLPARSAVEIEDQAEQVVTDLAAGWLPWSLVNDQCTELRGLVGLPIDGWTEDDRVAAHAGRDRCMAIAKRERDARRTTGCARDVP